MKGINFKDEMINAVISGKKTMTRRIIKPQPKFCDGYENDLQRCENILEIKPRYKVGETLYIKETYGIFHDRIFFKYFNPSVKYELGIEWKSKLFMPEKYARFFIKITSIKVERFQDISVKDCYKEGIYELPNNRFDIPMYLNGLKHRENLVEMFKSPKEAFADLIDKINGKGTWKNNPYVFVYEFNLVIL